MPPIIPTKKDIREAISITIPFLNPVMKIKVMIIKLNLPNSHC